MYFVLFNCSAPMGHPRLPRRVLAALACLISALAALGTETQAQLPIPDRSLQLEQLRQRAESAAAAGDTSRMQGPQPTTAGPAGPLLDRQISRTEYRLGPGDVVTVSIFGYQNALFSLAVTPEGSIIIPGVRIVPVGGLNIEQAERQVRHQVRRIYPDAEVGVSLTAVRSFRIFLVGEVPEPGAWSATPVTRVSEVIPAKNSDGIIYRNVQLRRPGHQLSVDLARFIRTGDLSSNPTLAHGDIIHVPAVQQTVTISGQVAYPGTYEFRPSESLAELMRVANGGGPFPSDAADSVMLLGFGDNPSGQVRTISRSDAASQLGSGIALEPFDAIFVPRVAYYKQQTTATIEGEVRRPGTYPIRPNGTSVSELIEMAGGFTPEASLARAMIRREPGGIPGDTIRPLQPIRGSLEEVALAQLTREELRSLQVTSRVDERDVIIDLTDNGPAHRLTLMDGDLLFVPRQRNEVVVLGAAANPGIVPYESGRSIDYYVQLAGGYSRRADVREVVVQRVGVGVRLHRNDLSVIDPGDRIIIPFRERMTFMDHVRTAQVVVGTISGLIITYYAVERIWR